MLSALFSLQQTAQKTPDKIAVIEGEQHVSYHDLVCYISGTMAHFKGVQKTYALWADNSLEWLVTDLALMALGKTVIPIPPFFSSEQIGHIQQDAKIDCVLVDLTIYSSNTNFEVTSGAQKIIYTSGTTGKPKGVIHGCKQLNQSIKALMQAADVMPDDIHLSVLPFALLLEQICGIYIPLSAGCTTVLATEVSKACAQGKLGPLVEMSQEINPTTCVLVPQQLKGWVATLEATQNKAPKSLRFIAVGGAPVPQNLTEKGWNVGLPIYEGYGLSECCSVVCVNYKKRHKLGTVGKALSHITLTIEDNEIVLSGPSLMEGYLNQPPLTHSKYYTGDIGSLDNNGFLTVYGRKDDVIVTSYGRNINAKWVEAMIVSDARILSCTITGHGQEYVSATITLSNIGQEWAKGFQGDEQIKDLINMLTFYAPDYARPKKCHVTNLNSNTQELEYQL